LKWIFAFIVINGGMFAYLAIFWTPLLGYFQPLERQWHLAYTFVLLLLIDIFLTSTLEVLVLHIWTPLLVRSKVRENFKDLFHSIVTMMLHTPPDSGGDDLDDPPFDAGKYLFVSKQVARRLPELDERVIVDNYRTTLPTHFRWRVGSASVGLHYLYRLPVQIQDLFLNVSISFLLLALAAWHAGMVGLASFDSSPIDIILLSLPAVCCIVVCITASEVLSRSVWFRGSWLDPDTYSEFGILPTPPPPPPTQQSEARATDSSHGSDGGQGAGVGTAVGEGGLMGGMELEVEEFDDLPLDEDFLAGKQDYSGGFADEMLGTINKPKPIRTLKSKSYL
jgi:hypothetical protein